MRLTASSCHSSSWLCCSCCCRRPISAFLEHALQKCPLLPWLYLRQVKHDREVQQARVQQMVHQVSAKRKAAAGAGAPPGLVLSPPSTSPCRVIRPQLGQHHICHEGIPWPTEGTTGRAQQRPGCFCQNGDSCCRGRLAQKAPTFAVHSPACAPAQLWGEAAGHRAAVLLRPAPSSWGRGQQQPGLAWQAGCF